MARKNICISYLYEVDDDVCKLQSRINRNHLCYYKDKVVYIRPPKPHLGIGAMVYWGCIIRSQNPSIRLLPFLSWVIRESLES